MRAMLPPPCGADVDGAFKDFWLMGKDVRHAQIPYENASYGTSQAFTPPNLPRRQPIDPTQGYDDVALIYHYAQCLTHECVQYHPFPVHVSLRGSISCYTVVGCGLHFARDDTRHKRRSN